VLVAAAAAALVAFAPAAQAGGRFFVGFDEDGLRVEGAAAAQPARALGAKAFRITLTWHPGETRVSFTDVSDLHRAVSAGKGFRIIVAIYGAAANAPKDASARNQYCRYARSVLVTSAAIKDIVIWNEPNTSRFWQPQFNADGTSAAPAAYEALAARCWDVLHAYRPGIDVIAPATAATGNDKPYATSNVSHSPGAFILALGDAYRASGRKKPILDTVGHHAYGDSNAERPWYQHIGTETIGEGDWKKLMSSLSTAFAGTGQPIPGQCRHGRCVSIIWMEDGFETIPDADKAALYARPAQPGAIPAYIGGEPDWPPPSPDSPAPDQATQIRDAIRLAYCQPYVRGFFNFLLWDESRAAGWQSAPYWADRTPKGSLPAFRDAIAEANAHSVDCELLKGGMPSADYHPPRAIGDLRASLSGPPYRVDLTWTPSSDSSGIAGYRIYRDDADFGWAIEPAFADTAVAPGTTHVYAVYAQDGAGNLSSVSNPVTVTTP
jgi:hypothetical protein